MLIFKAAHGISPTLLVLFPLRNYWSALCCGFSLSVINVVPHTIQFESFIWTHFSLPLKCQFEHQGLGDESSGQKDSLWVTVICWTSVSRHIMFILEPISQSISVIFHSWMDGQTSNKTSCKFSSRSSGTVLPRSPFQLSDSLNV